MSHFLPVLRQGLRPLLHPAPVDPGLDRERPEMVNLVASQHGIVSWSQARAAGVNERMIAWRVAVGRWQEIHPGVYSTYSGPLSPGSVIQAALLHAGEGAVVDGCTALGVHGVIGYDEPEVHVRVPHARHPEPSAGLVIRRSRSLTERSSVQRCGFPVIRVERAALTVAVAQPHRAGGVLSAVVQQGLTTGDRLEGYLLELGPVNGRAALRQVISDIAGGSRSHLELLFQRIVRAHDVERPIRNHPLVLEGRRLYLDNFWPRHRFFAEIDGKAYHLLSEDWEDDLLRQNLLVAHGFQPLRFSARQIREDPESVGRLLLATVGPR